VNAEKRLPWVLPALAAFALAGAWPLTAYEASPLLMPVLLAVAGVAALVVARPEYGIGIALALAPWTNIEVPGVGGEAISLPEKPLHLLIPVLAFAVLGYGLLVSRSEHDHSRSPWLTAAVLVFVAAAVVTSMQALEPSDSVNKVVLLLTAAALFFGVLQICQERLQLIVVAAGAVLGLAFAAGQGVSQHYSGEFGEFGFVAGGGVVQRVQGSFGHPNQYGGFIAMLLPLAFATVVTKRLPTALRWLGGVAFALGVFALVYSYARGAIAALVLGSIVWLAFVKPRAAVLAGVALVIAAVAFAPGALKQRFNAQGLTDDVPLRADIWQSALDIYARNPVLGVGVNNFPNAYEELPSSFTTASQRRLLHQTDLLTPPHAQSLYLNVMAEEGLIGLGALVLLALAALGVVYRGARVRDPVGRAICIGIGAGVMTLGVHSFLEAELLGEIGLPFFGLLAVAAGFVALDREDS
jgi:O-antigen ligase